MGYFVVNGRIYKEFREFREFRELREFGELRELKEFMVVGGTKFSKFLKLPKK